MKSTKIQQLTRTALLLALCIASQYLIKNQYITGSIVNAILILATLVAGLYGGLAIAVLSPVFAFLTGLAPAVPPLIAIIALGNAIMVLSVHFFKGKKLPLGLVAGSICKAGFLFLATRYVLFTLFASMLKPKQVENITIMFSYPQIITAAIGSVLAFGVYMVLKKTLLKKA